MSHLDCIVEQRLELLLNAPSGARSGSETR